VLLVCSALGWTTEGILQSTIPLVVLDRGGDAATVGLVTAAFAVPTVILRPLVGQRIDVHGHGGVHRLGAALMSASSLGLVAPALVLVAVFRAMVGVGWAMYSTTNMVVMARLAPVRRRAEVNGYMSATVPLGFLVGPAVGIWLYQQVGEAGPFLAAASCSAVALAAAIVLARLLPRPLTGGTPRPAGEPRRGGRLGWLVEPSAVPAFAIITLFMTSAALFLAFAPVVARYYGAPLESLALYYPAYSTAMAIGQLGLSRISDRIGRRTTVVGGALVAVVSLTLALVSDSFAVFAVAGPAFALAAGTVIPTLSAATIDLAPPGRMASAVATYTMGFQLAIGAGALVWGALMVAVGLGAAFAVAIVFQLAVLVIAWTRMPGRPAPDAPQPSRAEP
jgi:MFS family permease